MIKVPLAADHQGLRAQGSAFLTRNGRGFTGKRAQMAAHLEELATRFYAGDLAVVDEFLQLYCFGEESRKQVKARQGWA